MTDDKRRYAIALGLLKGVGDVLARHLLQHFGNPEPVFSEKKHLLEKVPGIGKQTVAKIVASRADALKLAEEELAFVDKNKIRVYSILEDDYPYRLRECQDAPMTFYFKGRAELNAARVISVVGTRNATEYGRSLTEAMLRDLAAMFPDVLVVSGLAYGIDICAHRNALKNGLPTVGVLAHGLDRIYPAFHRNIAVEMLGHGGLLTDFVSKTTPVRENFLQRNRLIAGLADATVVVESAEKGGALVTANIAFSYSRDVYSFPGRTTDEHSCGCNRLIQTNRAGLITSARDLAEALGWDTAKKTPGAADARLPFRDSVPDHPLLALLAEKGEMQINDLATSAGMPVYRLSPMLFELELAGHVKALPGSVYKLNL
ncbi:MAG: DNA-processing protein DprA [Tannerella sp.]|jgi:DNA processing protein|nr:DNA-processing protein DprA [Tannerella sp.]